MTYGDPTNPSTGRAQVPGSPDPAGLTGRASASASVPPPSGTASVRPPTGSASVPGAFGSASVGGARGSASVGSASVPAVAGRATVGRAVVRAPGDDDAFGAGPGGPGGPPGPVGRGPRGARPPRKKRRRRNIVIAAIAAFIMLAGVGMVSGTYYFDKVELPQNIAMKESTTIYYSDGVTPIAKIGEENRTFVTIDKVPLGIQHAIVATEDNSFYTNSGVDYRGVARAAWNNITGGDQQGASTISQQYARKWADLSGVTYARKLREAVIAMKLNKQFSKSQIMEMYLNIVYFGRQAYGIEAAAQAYFGKDVGQLTTAEGMVLAGCIKDPEGTNGKGSPYDPTVNKTSAMERFNNYIKPNMLRLKFVTQDEYDKMTYPTTVVPLDTNNSAKLRAQWGLDTPQGLIVHHVMDELSKVKKPDGSLKFADTSGSIKNGIRNGGLKIITTINKSAENDAIGMAGGTGKGSPIAGQPPNLQAALVSVEPTTGRVVAYYGGATGSGNDYAAFYNDPVLGNGEDSCCAGHPPGSSFKIYTLATALIAGYSITSYWNGDSPQDFPKSGRTKATGNPVKNAGDGGGGPGKCLGGAQHCMLWEATQQSLNTPFFGVTEAVGADHVLDTAKAAGIRYMWATVKVNGQDTSVRENVQTAPSTKFVPNYFQTEIGFGQYPITVLDHANGTATIAARGYAADVHFVREVDQSGKKIYNETINPKRIPGFNDAIADDMDWVLKKIPEEYHITLANGRDSAGKTGTWQLGQSTNKTAHAWFTGYTGSDIAKKSTGLATSVWVGNKGQEQPLQLTNGQSIIGGRLPGPIWKAYMDKAFVDLNEPKITFPGPKNQGTREEGNATSPLPSVPVVPPDPNNPIPGGPPSQGPSNGAGGNGGGGVVPRASRSKNG